MLTDLEIGIRAIISDVIVKINRAFGLLKSLTTTGVAGCKVTIFELHLIQKDRSKFTGLVHNSSPFGRYEISED